MKGKWIKEIFKILNNLTNYKNLKCYDVNLKKNE